MTSQKINRVHTRFHFAVIVLLLHGLGEVIGFPVVVSGGAAPLSTAALQSHNSNKLLITMPVWAKKAGGNWRPELVQIKDAATDPLNNGNQHDPDYTLGRSENENLSEDLDVETTRVSTADESGSSFAANKQHGRQQQQQHRSMESERTKVSTEEESKQDDKDGEYEYEYDELHPEEEECPEDKFWHVRGLKCVPFDCPGGNTWRDRNTGDCILKYYGRSRWRSRPWRP